ncbi:MAG: hypothetical protein WD316_00960 [Phycisphaeraceae bacterium]
MSKHEPAKQDRQQNPPDNRGPRPTDPNQLAKWLVDQVTGEDDDKQERKGRQGPGGQNQRKSA